MLSKANILSAGRKGSREQGPAWKKLISHQKSCARQSLRGMFEEDSDRAKKFTLSHENFTLDYSKNNITDETVSLLCALAKSCDLEQWRDDLFSGAPINTTENRAALHTALRSSVDTGVMIDGENVSKIVRDNFERMQDFVQKVDAGSQFTDIVNIGIGGSDIGPYVAWKALRPFAQHAGRSVHFMSNIDPSHIQRILRPLDPAKTLFIISSKSFSTQETLTNAASAKDWIAENLGAEKVSEHFVAITGKPERAQEFGVTEENIFPLWDWVGGRYSLWSAIGLPVMLSIGAENFKDLLAGAESADKHFKEQPFETNIPVLMAMLGVWYRNFWNYGSYAILPYHQNLRELPRYLQQLDMESNGKSVDRDGNRVDYPTAPVMFGEVGTNGQHAFHQCLHQGTDIVPCDFLVSAKTREPCGDHQEKLLANAVAQAQALMRGKNNKDEPHRHFEGGRPSNFIILDELTPYSLGILMAFYEHKAFVQGVIWNLNSFDQYGVELGKVLSHDVLDALQGGTGQDFDSSTQSIIEKIKHSA